MLRVKKITRVIYTTIVCLLIVLAVEWHYTEISFLQLKRTKAVERIDWHDYDFIRYERTRNGPGERGGYVLTDPEDIEENERLMKVEGFSLLVSDRISVTRALIDPRHENCKSKKYLEKLPNVSVVIVYYNEPFSVLLRGIHSVYNRTPKELLHEIILMNDNSSMPKLYKPLEDYVHENFNGKVKVFHNPTRLGAIVTRVEGASRATGEILIFLDSHMEVTTNWLPPLLDPITLNRKVVTVPKIDVIDGDNLGYYETVDHCNGGFDWSLRYSYFILSEEEYPVRGENHILWAMTGGAFAIDRKYFFEIGGFDTGLHLYNAENWDLTFKIQMCGGMLMAVPCSKVGHLTRKFKPYSTSANGIDYFTKNLRRIVDVWFDEYKFMFYKDHPEYYETDPGDLSTPIALRKKLNCKPFKYYLEHIAPGILERFPIVERPAFASGAIQSKADPSLCFDVDRSRSPLSLGKCSENLVHPPSNQDFILTWHRMIRLNDTHDNCLCEEGVINCQNGYKPEVYKYKLDTLQIIRYDNGLCLTADLEHLHLVSKECISTDVLQKWEFGYKNLTNLNNWDTYGLKIDF